MTPYVQDADFTPCECGCGDPAPIATYSHAKRGWVKGQPKRFISGHNGRGERKQDRYEVRACGYDTACWVWLLHRDEHGYGRVSRPGERITATRAPLLLQRTAWMVATDLASQVREPIVCQPRPHASSRDARRTSDRGAGRTYALPARTFVCRAR